MAESSSIDPNAPVAVVIQTRVADSGVAAYVGWQSKVGGILSKRKGFLDQKVIAPSAPNQVDWIVIQRFRSLEEARSWIQSDELQSLLSEVCEYFVGSDDVYLRAEAEGNPATALVSCRVAPEHEEGFLKWERDAFAVEAKAPGFVGHRLDRPVPGVQENWVIALSFDTEENLTKWLESPERAALLKEGELYQGGLQIRKIGYGFDFWSRSPQSGPPSPMAIFKGNLLVLLVLYPIVYLWGYLFSHPFVDAPGAPPWVSLFIGNVVSTQILGWWVVPWIMKVFSAWLAPKPTPKASMNGWVALIVLYALSMALFAYILTLKPLEFF